MLADHGASNLTRTQCEYTSEAFHSHGGTLKSMVYVMEDPKNELPPIHIPYIDLFGGSPNG